MRKPAKNRKNFARIGNTYYRPLSKKNRNPKDYIHTSYNNTHLKDFYKNCKKYPWESWSDGSWWEVFEGVDYFISTRNFQQSLHVRGWRYGYRVNCYRMPNGKSIRFQFYTGNPRWLNLKEHGVHWRDVRQVL